MLWIITLIMTALAMVLLLRPFFVCSKNIPNRAEYDMRIYQDQLHELKRDTGNNLFTSEEESSAQMEVARRILKADKDLNLSQTSANIVINQRIALLVGLLIPIIALGIYFFIGSPNLVSQSPSQLKSKLAQENAKPKMNLLILELKKRLESRPDDIEGWSLYARSLSSLGELSKATNAYRKVLALDPKNIQFWAELFELQFSKSGGVITKGAKHTLKNILLLNPADPLGRFYSGLAAEQAGKFKKALKIWLTLEKESNSDAPWTHLLSKRINTIVEKHNMSREIFNPKRVKDSQNP